MKTRTVECAALVALLALGMLYGNASLRVYGQKGTEPQAEEPLPPPTDNSGGVDAGQIVNPPNPAEADGGDDKPKPEPPKPEPCGKCAEDFNAIFDGLQRAFSEGDNNAFQYYMSLGRDNVSAIFTTPSPTG